MADWRTPLEPTPDDVPLEGDGAVDDSTAGDLADAGAAESVLADPGLTDPFSDEIADVDASGWDADALWGPDTLAGDPGDFTDSPGDYAGGVDGFAPGAGDFDLPL
jgi:hypothetical protein